MKATKCLRGKQKVNKGILSISPFFQAKCCEIKKDISPNHELICRFHVTRLRQRDYKCRKTLTASPLELLTASLQESGKECFRACRKSAITIGLLSNVTNHNTSFMASGERRRHHANPVASLV